MCVCGRGAQEPLVVSKILTAMHSISEGRKPGPGFSYRNLGPGHLPWRQTTLSGRRGGVYLLGGPVCSIDEGLGGPVSSADPH